MDQKVLKLMEAFKEGKKPDIRTISNYVHQYLNPINARDWDALSAEVCDVYGFTPEELSLHIKTPLFISPDDYVDDFNILIKELEIGGWIREYVEHTRNMEAPTAYHFATALTVLGASLKRQVFVDQAYYKIWPAVQTILVGPSGKTKKSTAASYGIALAEDSGRVQRLSDEFSAEALKTELSQISKINGDSCGILYASELGTALGKQEYNVNLVQTLTDLFDSRSSLRRRTQARGVEQVKNIAVSFLGCSNEKWLADALPPSAFQGGFMSRILVFHQTGTDREFHRPVLADKEMREVLRTELIRTQFTKGEAMLEPDADKFYAAMYKKIKAEWPEDERVAPFWERVPDHMLRMGMLLSISEDLKQHEVITITEKHAKQAYEVLMWIAKYLPKIYAGLGLTAFSAEQALILTFLQRKGGIMTEAELGRKTRVSKRRLDEHLETLERNRCVSRVLENDEYNIKLLRRVDEL